MSSAGRERWLIVAAMAMAVGLIAAAVMIGVLWSTATANGNRIGHDRIRISALEAQVRSLGAIPVTQAPTIVVLPSTTMTTPPPAPFPPTTLGPPANPPASAAQTPAPAPEPTTTTTTAPPPPTTTPPTTPPCVTIPVVGSCVPTRASRSSTRGETVESTAYCLTGNMANGQPTHVGAVAGNRWPLGTVLEVSDSPYGPGRFTVEDRIGWGSELDFATPGDCAAANAWGRRFVTTEVIS